MLHPLEHVGDHQNPLAHTPALAPCQAPQLRRPRFAAKELCRHRLAPKNGTLARSLYHIWDSLKAGITAALDPKRPSLGSARPAAHCQEGDLRVTGEIGGWDGNQTVG